MDRYTGEKIVDMPHRNGTQVRVVLRRPRLYENQRYITYTITAADRMWTLADKYYRNSLDWWVIADMNPQITCPDDLVYGLTALIPIS